MGDLCTGTLVPQLGKCLPTSLLQLCLLFVRQRRGTSQGEAAGMLGIHTSAFCSG